MFKAIFCILSLVCAIYCAPTEEGAEPLACPNTKQEVCGTDFKTYDNEECLRYHNPTDPRVRVRSQGECPAARPVCMCTLELNPVCGTDGFSYPTACMMRCEAPEGVTVAKSGFCDNDSRTI